MSHDIFVSYAHADDHAPGTARYGGVTTFVEELKKLLFKKIGGSGADVWMDHLLAANEHVSETLERHVQGSRTILLFMSPGYLKSIWCRSELEQFLTLNQTDFHRDNVFVVMIEETDRSDWPERVQALTSLEFFERELSGATRTLGWPYPPLDPDSKYWSRLNELAHSIRNQLRNEVHSRPLTGISDTSPTKPIAKPTVWIAQCTDLQDEWEKLASAVRQAGASVLPCGANTYPEKDASAFKLAVTQDLLQADLLVQLLADDAGTTLGDGLLERVALIQNEMARVLKSGLYPRLIRWRKGGVPDGAASESTDPYSRLLLGAIAEPFEQFRSFVVGEVQRLVNPDRSTPKDSAANTDALTVCVTAADADRSLADKVCDVVGGLGSVPIPVDPKPSEGQSQTEYREQFEELLGSVDGVILVHGTAPPMWLHSRHAQVRKVLAQRNQTIWGAFLDGPPPDKRNPVECKGPGLLTLSCRTGLSTPPIAEFLQQLRS